MFTIRYAPLNGQSHSAVKNYLAHRSTSEKTLPLSRYFDKYDAELTFLHEAIGFDVDFKDPKLYTLFLMEWS